jgi:hypothetical protein
MCVQSLPSLLPLHFAWKIRTMIAVMHNIDAQLGMEEAKDYRSEQAATNEAQVIENAPQSENGESLGIHVSGGTCEVVLFHVTLYARFHGTVELRLEVVVVLITRYGQSKVMIKNNK